MNTLWLDLKQNSLWIAVAWILFNPLFWNYVARKEHSTHFLTRLAGSAHRGCYLLGVTIFAIGIIRDHFYKQALENQPTHTSLDQPIIQTFASFIRSRIPARHYFHVVTGLHRYLPGRLLWNPNGPHGPGFPLQPHFKPHV